MKAQPAKWGEKPKLEMPRFDEGELVVASDPIVMQMTGDPQVLVAGTMVLFENSYFKLNK